MSAKKTIDTPAWLSLGLLIFLTSLIIRDDSLRLATVLFAAGVLLLFWLAGNIWRYAPKLTDAGFALLVSAYLYKLWPHMFFDDAGFILRYLDHLHRGYWFQYNAGEGAVFGISGFLHGLYTSLLVKCTGMSPERALHVSNLTGLAAVLFFMAGIFRYFVHKPGWAYAATFTVVCLTKTWGDVLFTGMETPLHVAFIMGAMYFWLYGPVKWFYGFAALSVISKLDAVPVMVVLLLFHAVEQVRKNGFGKTVSLEVKPLLIGFALPLAVWTGFAYAFFGSPFPQSAKAKVLYHRAASDAFFPFLQGFIDDGHKYPMLWLLAVLLVVHTLMVKKHGLTAITRHFAFGWMFVAIMGLYYFYNPNERMLWYYALPDLLLTAQCVLSGIWLASLAKDWKGHAVPTFVLLGWLLYLVPDVNGARAWMFSYLEKVERERYEIGKYIAAEASPGDTLLAWHGLIARPFPGYVLDGTGLNSPKALALKLDRDSMLAAFKPSYGIHHGYEYINASFYEQGYTIKGMFGDVTLENWPAWIWWQKSVQNYGYRTRYKNITDSMVVEGKITHTEEPLKVEGARVVFVFPEKITGGKLWGAFEGRRQAPVTVRMHVWGDSLLLAQKNIKLPPYGAAGYPSLFTFGAGTDFYVPDTVPRTIRLEFLPTGADTMVKINNPIVEYQTFHPER